MNALPRQAGPQVLTLALPNAHYYGLRAAVPGVAALQGRLRTGAVRDPAQAALARLTAALVAYGGRQHEGMDLAERMESCGASYSVEAEDEGLRFSARAGNDDLPQVADWLFECLRAPEFDQAQLDAERGRLIAELDYQSIDPGFAAAGALTRLLYPPAHPLYEADAPLQIAHLEAVTLEQVRGYHRQRYGANELRIAVVGDVDPARALRWIERGTAGWAPTAVASGTGSADAVPAQTEDLQLLLPEQDSYGIALGQRVALGRTHPDYLALRLADRMLGGSFASRLVAQVREQHGLSYALRSSLVTPHRGSGHWQIALSVSPQHLQAALAATRAVIAEFADGVGEEEFATARRAAIGAYQIGLATLDGLGEALLSAAEQGWETDDLLAYERRMSRIGWAQLNDAIAEHLRPQQWRGVVAGPHQG
ncbi:M16 family metallopeptidase [Lysobacter silvisoli]|uniref:Insulinase family protein n=1 Tax=Lysobacter silvisoli TaxID=2293254 RepID=A0A371K0C7_9GAMM|nr:pitrilysin family protein [Lysobacter silvisoli]RDZ27368.1 insulinase family protein [Lysobacter silvisoli]